MTAVRTLFAGCLLLVAGTAMAQLYSIPPGAYRTGAAYHRRQPQPAGTDAFYPDKRGQVVVVVRRGSQNLKLRVAPDSVWGYVTGKDRTYRLHRGEEYRLEFADTLCVYSSTTMVVDGQRVSQPLSAPRYFFSRGLAGLIFPLTTRYLREAYAASNPAFAAALGELRFDQSLADFDRKTGLYRVTTIYRKTATP
ncbi:hypothetical protein [Hymenobacter terrenus]|uniref:hypothetical protein n=1 Tax=Hymenobacter terrenus TaxID=1629124 RepID=UPI00061983BC|nr:hypothetical protein [Hymenobacter terrenus]